MRKLGAYKPNIGKRFLSDTSGGAAAELVLWLSVMLVPVMSVIDVGFYAFQRLQVEFAAEAGAQAARLSCKDSAAPFTDNCGTLTSAVTTAVQSTVLKSTVSLTSGYPAEGYYCVNSTTDLTLVGSAGVVGTPPTKPSPFTCQAVTAGSTAAPGTYIRIAVQKTFTPVFANVSVASLLPSPITATAWLRTE